MARCGPGDADLQGTITIEGCDAAGKVVPDGARYTIPLKVFSSLKSGFTQIGDLKGSILWHDRNIGAPQSDIGDEALITIPALPFSNVKGDYQSADQNGLTYTNALFKGTYHRLDELEICPVGWRAPITQEFNILLTQMQWAKAGARPYIVANKGEDIGNKGCYFPLAGSGSSPNFLAGFYWAKNATLQISPTTIELPGLPYTTKQSVRCVRDI